MLWGGCLGGEGHERGVESSCRNEYSKPGLFVWRKGEGWGGGGKGGHQMCCSAGTLASQLCVCNMQPVVVCVVVCVTNTPRYPIVSLPDNSRPPRPTRETAVEPSDSGLWASEWVVGFNKPHLAASFRTEALARHLWDRPVRKQQQQQRQEQETQQCGAGSGGCVVSGSSGGGSSSGIPCTVTVLWYPEDYPPVTNHRELVTMLEELTEPYGFKVRGVLCLTQHSLQKVE